MRILYVTTIGGTMNFFSSFIRQLLDKGHVVEIATNEESSPVPECYREWGCTVHPISTSRSPFSTGNLKAIRQLRQLVAAGGYEIVHCHTPLAAAATRLACSTLRKKGVKVIYTAHGFHFYKGAPKLNWLIFYPVEKICAWFTDLLITINQEDHIRAKAKLKAKRVEYVPGVGIDGEAFGAKTVDKAEKRGQLGIPADAFLLLSVGELNENKNHSAVICALAALQDPKMHYAIAGRGGLQDELLALAAELGVENQVHLLGFRKDVAQLYQTADVYVHPSFREGLPVAVMEAMASGLPCIVSRIRGNADLIPESSGSLCAPEDVESFARLIAGYRDDPARREAAGRQNAQAASVLDIRAINEKMYHLYLETMGN